MNLPLRTLGLVAGGLIAGLSLVLPACAPKPPAQVSRQELTEMRQSNASIKSGDSKQKVLDAFRKGNVVKLGSSSFNGATVEEWKAEGFHDESHRKDLFVTFLYFVDDTFVDSSDSRIDFRANTALVERWRASVD